MRFLILFVCMLPLSLFAEEKKLGWKHDSALGYVVTGGNSTAETMNFKQETKYTWEKSIVVWSGNYLASKAKDQTSGITAQNAENWATLLRYDRVYSDRFSSYLQTGISGDRFQGLRERKTGGLGAKYYTVKGERFTWFKEFGYEYARELYIESPQPEALAHQEFHFARLATQADYSVEKNFKIGFKAEYLYPFADQQFDEEGVEDKKDYRINFSPYLTSVLSDLLSLQIAYQGQYRNVPVVVGNEYLDFTFTTSLIATY